MSQMDIATALIRAKQDELKVGEISPRKRGLVSFCFKLMLAYAPARGRGINVVTDLCLEVTLALESDDLVSTSTLFC